MARNTVQVREIFPHGTPLAQKGCPKEEYKSFRNPSILEIRNGQHLDESAL